jgi:hypothetical protein
MKNRLPLALTLVLAGLVETSSPASLSAQAGGGWTTLFDGKTLTGWNMIGNANWEVADGLMQASKGNGFLVTPRSYTDFQITLEFWVSDDANSGVFIRCSDPKTISAANAYEVNIFDQRPDPSYGTGAIVNVAKASPVLKTGGKWNTYDITAKGPKMTIVLNGTKTAEVENTLHPSGPIGLQYGAGTVKFRNVRIRTL